MKGDAGRGCNALKSCLKVGGLDDKTLTQSFVRILELSQKRNRQVILPIKLGLYFFLLYFCGIRQNPVTLVQTSR